MYPFKKERVKLIRGLLSNEGNHPDELNLNKLKKPVLTPVLN
jgi:hypothetical protein